MALGSIFKVIIDETSLLHSIPVPLDFKTVYSKDKFSVFLQHIKFYSIIDILLLDLSFINSFLDLQLKNIEINIAIKIIIIIILITGFISRKINPTGKAIIIKIIIKEVFCPHLPFIKDNLSTLALSGKTKYWFSQVWGVDYSKLFIFINFLIIKY